MTTSGDQGTGARDARKRRVATLVVLLVSGVAAGVIFRGPLRDLVRGVVPASDADWDRQVAMDASSLLEVVRPDRVGVDITSQKLFRDAWDARRGRYPPEKLADLRERLRSYLDFLEIEHGECADIWRTGATPDRRSAASDAARDRVVRGFGELGPKLVRQADDLREEAYRSSPRVAAGVDPDDTDFVAALEALRRALPACRRRVDELTEPLR